MRMNRRLECVFLLMTIPSFSFAANEFHFNWDILEKEMGMTLQPEDIERMKEDAILGTHLYDLYVNTELVGTYELEIVKSENSHKRFEARIPAALLQQLSLNPEKVGELLALSPSTIIDQISNYIDGATIELDTDLQTCHISVPQIFYLKKKRQLLPPMLWNYGIPALRLQYSGDYSMNRYLGQNNHRGYFSLNSQMNLGPWRLINRSSMSADSERTQFNHLQSYLTRTIPSYHARVDLGQMTATSRYVEGIPMRGISLYEDEGQLEPVDRSYLPVINGIADSRAIVSVRQNGRLLLEEEVPAGPFEFVDIPSLGYSGDIDVEVKELNGKEKHFTVPYMGSSRLLKTDRMAWNLAVGKFDGTDDQQNPWIASGAIGYGLPGGVTVYGGGIYSDLFKHYVTGAAFDAGRLGALSIQIDHNRQMNGVRRSGSSFEVDWSKNYALTNSSVNIGYRQTFDGKLGSFQEAMSSPRVPSYSDFGLDDYVKKSLSFSLSQSLGKWGNLSANGILEKSAKKQDYQSISLSYSFLWKKATFYLQAQHQLQETVSGIKNQDWQAFFRVGIPLSVLWGKSDTPSTARLEMSVNRDEDGFQSKQLGLSSSLLDGRLSYSLQARENLQNERSVSGSFNYRGDHASIGASASSSNDSKSLSANVSGAVLVSQYGVDFLESIHGSLALVAAPDVDQVSLLSGGQGHSNGRVIANNLSDYQANEIQLNPNEIPSNVTLLDGLNAKVVPADKAVLYVPFKTFKGKQVLFTILTESGESVPFGSEVVLTSGESKLPQTVTDETGAVYFASAPMTGNLNVLWRSKQEGLVSCSTPYVIQSTSENPNDLYVEELICVKSAK